MTGGQRALGRANTGVARAGKGRGGAGGVHRGAATYDGQTQQQPCARASIGRGGAKRRAGQGTGVAGVLSAAAVIAGEAVGSEARGLRGWRWPSTTVDVRDGGEREAGGMGFSPPLQGSLAARRDGADGEEDEADGGEVRCRPAMERRGGAVG